MAMNYNDAFCLIEKAYEKITEDKLFTRWITNHAHVPYDVFKNSLIVKAKNDNRTTEEILNNVEEMMKLYKFEEVKIDGI